MVLEYLDSNEAGARVAWSRRGRAIWKKLGIELKFRPVDFAALYQQRLRTVIHDIISIAFGGITAVPESRADLFGSVIKTDDSGNLAGVNSPAAMGLLAQMTAMNPASVLGRLPLPLDRMITSGLSRAAVVCHHHHARSLTLPG
jgi:microcin C transport system substrate-binding protein